MVLKLREDGRQDKKLIQKGVEGGCGVKKEQYNKEGWRLERDVNLKEDSCAQSLSKQEGNNCPQARYLNRE